MTTYETHHTRLRSSFVKFEKLLTMSGLTQEEHRLLGEAVNILYVMIRTKGIPMRIKYRQTADPTNPRSPFPILKPLPVPRQTIWPLLLDAALYIRDHEVVHTDDDIVVINRVIKPLVDVNRNLLFPPWQSQRIREKQGILDKMVPYVHGDINLIVKENMKQPMMHDVLAPIVSIIERL